MKRHDHATFNRDGGLAGDHPRPPDRPRGTKVGKRPKIQLPTLLHKQEEHWEKRQSNPSALPSANPANTRSTVNQTNYLAHSLTAANFLQNKFLGLIPIYLQLSRFPSGAGSPLNGCRTLRKQNPTTSCFISRRTMPPHIERYLIKIHSIKQLGCACLRECLSSALSRPKLLSNLSPSSSMA
jgi:hypothetical protein